jgi:hypothetical protein
MKNGFSVEFADRLKSAAMAKRSLIDRFQPKATQIDPLHAERKAMRQTELAAVRAERLAGRAAKKKEAAADAPSEAARVQIAAGETALAVKRGVRKKRKALSEAEAKAKRDAKYAARKARA